MIFLKGWFWKMKNIHFTVFGTLLTFGILFSACDNGSTDTHPGLKTSLQIVTASSTLSSFARSIVTPAKVEVYIEDFGIRQVPGIDPLIHRGGTEAVGLFLVGLGGFSGGSYDNRGWYDVTTPRTYSIMNDVNPYQYSSWFFDISKVRIDGVEIQNSAFSAGDAQMANPIIITDSTTELVGILSMDVEDIYDDETEQLISDWENRISINLEVR
jgi:hypothetical protein